MNLSALVGGLLDPYERKARIFPGLLVVLPLLIPMVCIFGHKDPAMTAVIALIGGCGVTYGSGCCCCWRSRIRAWRASFESSFGVRCTASCSRRTLHTDFIEHARNARKGMSVWGSRPFRVV
ncbi:hypothetical protein [Variovorax sp. DT-64]|uniref:hypothetical protein n=1 Tax=Variovorax sp. DT-64 TaxID=3396160 RepID=UPI003F53F43E